MYKKLIQLLIHFIFGLMDVLDNLGPNIKLTWNYGEAHLLKGMLNCGEIVYYIEEVST